jgi:hypothetical protein
LSEEKSLCFATGWKSVPNALNALAIGVPKWRPAMASNDGNKLKLVFRDDHHTAAADGTTPIYVAARAYVDEGGGTTVPKPQQIDFTLEGGEAYFANGKNQISAATNGKTGATDWLPFYSKSPVKGTVHGQWDADSNAFDDESFEFTFVSPPAPQYAVHIDFVPPLLITVLNDLPITGTIKQVGVGIPNAPYDVSTTGLFQLVTSKSDLVTGEDGKFKFDIVVMFPEANDIQWLSSVSVTYHPKDRPDPVVDTRYSLLVL